MLLVWTWKFLPLVTLLPQWHVLLSISGSKGKLGYTQLVLAKTKIIPAEMTLPRAELFAATLNATTGHIVNLSLKEFIVGRVNLIDNQVALFWITSNIVKLRQWVRGQVV